MTNWKNKLLAFLHDPPSKALDILNHESLALTLLRQAGFSEEEAERFSRQADWAASTNFWQDRQGKHLVLLGYLYQITEPIAAWAEIRPLIQTLRLAVENHRA